jgi:hypothetical protein
MLMLAVADTVLSVMEVAVKMTCEAKAVAPDGALYMTEAPLAACWGGKVPQSTFVQSKPGADIVQLTPPFAGSFVTVALMSSAPPTKTVLLGTSIEIEIGLMIVRTANAVFVWSLTEIAVTVTWFGGLLVGAVYVVAAPLAVEVGETNPHDEVEQDTVHVTP